MDKKNFTSISLQEEMQRSYLEYAMSVIVGRALPDARDGLKPVQRRILFAMYELGLTPDRPFRKCARVVGDVLGKYHPHGDQAVYDALVRLIQNFSTKYPTLDGHGNFGSVDNDPPAAMRYTETRLAPIAHKGFLEEIGSETVNFSNNFDGSQKEPDVLPAQLPFLLLNGSSGIAVGMATNIPPHNLGEIVDGLIALVKNKDISNKKLYQIIQGPDFPTGGELIHNEAIEELYTNGKGSITIRGVINTEEINFLVQDNFSYDDEIDDPKDVKRKQLAFKEELAKAKTHLHDQKSKYYKEVKPSSNLNKEQQKAIDFFNRYSNEQQAVAQVKEKATNTFNQKTNEVFNEEFKGFDFNIDNRKFKFKLKDVDKVKNTQMDIMNVVGSYLDKDKVTLSDGYGYHKALFAAQNADSIANHFYQLGKTEAVKEISAESKNINMDPRQAGTGYVESGGIKVRAISGDDSSKLRIKLKK